MATDLVFEVCVMLPRVRLHDPHAHEAGGSEAKKRSTARILLKCFLVSSHASTVLLHHIW